jgi:hypothetical protein
VEGGGKLIEFVVDGRAGDFDFVLLGEEMTVSTVISTKEKWRERWREKMMICDNTVLFCSLLKHIVLPFNTAHPATLNAARQQYHEQQWW